MKRIQIIYWIDKWGEVWKWKSSEPDFVYNNKYGWGGFFKGEGLEILI